MHDALGVMWGKSSAAGSMHLLLAHLLDTAAVAELIWDRYLSLKVRRELDECAGGSGRALLSLLCGLHDVGKATPAFQSKDAELAAAVRSAGFDWSLPMDARNWPHTVAGARIVLDALGSYGWGRSAQEWTWPLVAGHHGRVPGWERLELPDRHVHGRGRWPAAQRAFVDRVADELGIELGALAGLRTPSRGAQLALAGLVVMADWVASDHSHFGGISDLAGVSMAAARERSARSWSALGLRGGWKASALASPAEPDLVRKRFGHAARPVQRAAVALAEQLTEPGLLILEAPMGEGKTEAALAAVEILARKFGADGVFVGMPTQATSDPMFTRVRRWLATIDPEVPVALLHGRSRCNKEWAGLREAARFGGVGDDPYALPNPYDVTDQCCADPSGAAAAEWFLGRKRGLLAPVVVGTVDQLLHAATRTRHVMLRHAGLAGRVVVLDEVHAYDVYMSQFLFEALRWLADARVPVVLLSATLPPSQRAALARAYAQGATLDRDVPVTFASVAGYPRLSAVCGRAGEVTTRALTSSAWRDSLPVCVEVLAESPAFDPTRVARAVLDETIDGGCALVVCNTVGRAQAVYRALRPTLGADVVLLHARLTAAARTERTERLVTVLGTGSERPPRLVIVATQLAEQSFDVDVDLLVSDLAPIDLLLQRIGRLHRHNRPPGARPERLRKPRVIVAGVCYGVGAPVFPHGSRKVYGEHLLLRAAALVRGAARTGWSVPAQVPDLVAAGYSDDPLGPPGWADAMARARAEHESSQADRAARAQQFLLAGEDQIPPSGSTPTLAGLHDRRTADLDDEDKVAAVVRDGDPSIEVVLVRGEPGDYRSLAGRPIGPQGEAVTDDAVLREVAGSAVRLPARQQITDAAVRCLAPLPGWNVDPWLGRTRALVLRSDLSVELGTHRLTYDDDLGLIVERSGS